MRSILENFLFGLLHPWSRADVDRWLQPVDIRIAGEADFECCLDLYDANVPHGVPIAHREIYAETLRSGQVLTFVAHQNLRPVGTFEIHQPTDELFWLSYMLVDPAYHRTGIGATMFIAALGVLTGIEKDAVLMFSALPTAVEFYERLGCERGQSMEDKTGQMCYYMRLSGITSVLANRCHKLVTKRGGTLPPTGYVIPRDDLPAVV
jgi:GNAT superfamily N-acetyltransferase